MSKKKVLIVTQEMEPYTTLSVVSKIARKLPQYIQEQGMEIRILMPRFGNINERRHRLHEVVRLSGMNIIVNDDDFPLIIKVASVKGARMQVYFLDNEDFFKRKALFEDANSVPFADNPDRMIFFCKGVIETCKKFGWPPDIIHCHGWMTSLIPLYIKTAYKTEPLFRDSKLLYSVYSGSPESTFEADFAEKASINDLNPKDLTAYQSDRGVTLHEGAATFADAIIQGSADIDENVLQIIQTADKPFLPYQGEDYKAAYIDFYHSQLEETVEES